MPDRDEIWEQIIAEAGERGFQSEPHFMADLIALKATNDEIRQRGIEWLLTLFIDLAAHANRHNIPIAVERDEPHRFAAYGANMVGIRTTFRYGVRCLTIEAGWTRMPRDGFMRGGALAVAHIRHFGIRQHGADLALLKMDDRHEWFEIDTANTARPVEPARLVRHLQVLIGREN